MTSEVLSALLARGIGNTPRFSIVGELNPVDLAGSAPEFDVGSPILQNGSAIVLWRGSPRFDDASGRFLFGSDELGVDTGAANGTNLRGGSLDSACP